MEVLKERFANLLAVCSFNMDKILPQGSIQECVDDMSINQNEPNVCYLRDAFSIKEFQIPCLVPEEELKSICKNEGLQYNPYQKCNADGEQESYEVELILGDSIEQGIHWYLIKWKNYSMSRATWEPKENLTGCDDILEIYHRGKKLGIDPKHLTVKSFPEKFTEFVKKLAKVKGPNADVASLMMLYKLSSKSKCDISHPVDSSSIKKLKQAALAMTQYSKKRITKLQHDLLNIMEFAKARTGVLESLRAFEEQVNKTASGGPFIRVANDVDCEYPPKDFKYINDYIFVGIPMRDEPIIGCECTECNKESPCCSKLAKEQFAYDKNGRLKLEPGYPIYECNSRCQCDESCMNRVVQKGSKIKLEIFRTCDERGWGLRTLERIKKGHFVVEYIGEVITSEQAEQRRYDDGDSYLFDLDFDQNICTYTVDAKQYGNSAHFINHACDPNLHVFALWINHLDPCLPRLPFFARRDIRCGEELTFDYRMKVDMGSNRLSQSFSSASEESSILDVVGNDSQNVPCTPTKKEIQKVLCMPVLTDCPHAPHSPMDTDLQSVPTTPPPVKNGFPPQMVTEDGIQHVPCTPTKNNSNNVPTAHLNGGPKVLDSPKKLSTPVKGLENSGLCTPVKENTENVTCTPVENNSENIPHFPVERELENVPLTPSKQDSENVSGTPVKKSSENVPGTPIKRDSENVAPTPVKGDSENVPRTPIKNVLPRGSMKMTPKKELRSDLSTTTPKKVLNDNDSSGQVCADEDQGKEVLYRRIRCLCKSSNCRGYLC